ncbi:BofC C-terminal domain-containing protein [Cohnella thailandensis]|uniref:BofC C-terminal domain-containing protein n=1 Tax=Cohnella thailandensis TaxID=557557 RepID=A0A841SSI4_9BACL|nr:BofC C-terminal domain-containing protein [Cohnella thailandensis]MBP1972622.1 forespore regulator of the sigma-K checkpoint [Cohnella thailandensis]
MFGLRIKGIKKRLKRTRRPVWTLGMWAGVVAAAVLAGTWVSGHLMNEYLRPASIAVESTPPTEENLPVSYEPESSQRGIVLDKLSGWNSDVVLVLHREYLCGEETRMLGRHSTLETMNLIKSHRDWMPTMDASGTVRVEERVDDLSPECRKSAYISLDRDGNLSLFDGPPRKEKIMRTFFQLDIKSLESSMSKEKLRELADGIRIADRDDYNHVLSSFSDFAKEPAKDVMRPSN